MLALFDTLLLNFSSFDPFQILLHESNLIIYLLLCMSIMDHTNLLLYILLLPTNLYLFSWIPYLSSLTKDVNSFKKHFPEILLSNHLSSYLLGKVALLPYLFLLLFLLSNQGKDLDYFRNISLNYSMTTWVHFMWHQYQLNFLTNKLHFSLNQYVHSKIV